MLYFARWKVALILIVILTGALFAIPNLFPKSERFAEDPVTGEETPIGIWNWLPNNSLNLGLDLQGGSHLLMEVDIDDVRTTRLERAMIEARRALREADIPADGFAVLGEAATLNVRDEAQVVAALEALQALAEPISMQVAPGGRPATDIAIESAGGRTIRITVTDAWLEDVRRSTVRDSIEVIRRRIDALGVTEPTIQRQGQTRLLIQAPGVNEPQRLLDIIGQTARMSFHLVVSDDPGDIQRAVNGGAISPLHLLAPQPEDAYEPFLIVERLERLSGDDLRRASQGFDPQDGEPVVNFSFDVSGAQTFCELTRANVNRRFATILDGEIITAPTIRSPICGGGGYIEGNFTVQSASDLAALLNAGALPAPLLPREQRSVGAQMGADSVAAGRIALIVGFVGVIVFMLAAYGLFGVFSNTALLVNIVLIVGALSGLQATLTLPGIAGIILTIGMAVDANVLIFERIREEVRAGRTPANAIESGFNHALSTILDANITTLIAAIVLFQFGSGPVRGFAVTLAIGIVTSVFTAFVFSRLLIAWWLKAAKPRKLAV